MGAFTTAWALINLLREYADKITVIIPYKAFSCATSVAIGADDNNVQNWNLGPHRSFCDERL